MKHRDGDFPRLTINPLDLPWMLEEWLPENRIGISARESGTQDWFVKFSQFLGTIHILGVANKFKYKESTSTLGPVEVNAEVEKAPQFANTCNVVYTLVIYSTRVSEAIAASILDGGGNASLVEFKKKSGFNDTTVVIVSPSDQNGLAKLLTPDRCDLVLNVDNEQSDEAEIYSGHNISKKADSKQH
jgi:hypothetical protein